MEEKRDVYRVLVGKPERDHLGDPGGGGRIILRWILRKWYMGVMDRAGSKQGDLAGTCECGNKPSGSVKCGEFLD